MVGAAESRKMSTRLGIVSLLGLFLLRCACGLSGDFWGDDPRQTFLIGFSAWARHVWPFFGADVVWTRSRLPGALQGLLIAGPLSVSATPEAPILVLNLLSFAALAGLAHYLTRRLPRLPAWFIWGTLLTTPWTTNFSTHIVNTSYILPAAIVFFIGFFEATPALASGLLRPFWAWSAMGFGLVWMMQIHMSWVLLPAYVAVAGLAAARSRTGGTVRRGLSFLAGAALPAALLVPTLMLAGTGGAEQNVQFHLRNPWTLVTILARFLSFPSFELNRFLGLNTGERAELLVRHWWLIPPAAALFVAGMLQPLFFAVEGVRARPASAGWPAVRLAAAGTVAWIYVSYFLSVTEPLAHAFYVTFPVAMIYAMHCWDRYAGARWFRRIAAAALVTNVLLVAGLAAAEWPERSLYRNRPLVMRAIAERQDRWLGERRWADERDNAVEAPQILPDAVRSASPVADLRARVNQWSTGAFGLASVFDVTIANTGHAAAYLDIQYVAHYFDNQAVEVRTSRGVMNDIIEPGETRRWDHFVDGRPDPRTVRATFEIVDAERVIPALRLGRCRISGNPRPRLSSTSTRAVSR